jgi:uncharacterized protein with PIN domain/sulfur carrier protein ThiS
VTPVPRARATLDLRGGLAALARTPGDPVTVPVRESRSVKDAVESVGIPHTEVGAVAVDDEPVDWGHRLVGGERVEVHPVEGVPPGWPVPVAARPPEPRRFVVDVHLGTLARRLRLLGFDTWWRNDADDPDLARRGRDEHRILATRDRQLLMRREVRHGVLVRSQDPDLQVVQVVARYGLASRARPRSRCVRCNGRLVPAEPAEVMPALEPGTRAAAPDRFARCRACGQVYWPGAHDDALERLVRRAVDDPGRTP